jgi:hypothetical protein
MERKTEMAEILLCRHPYSLDSLYNIHDMYSLRLKHKPRTGPPILRPYQPYLHSTRPSVIDENILATLDHHLPKKDITDMAFEFGEDNAIAITEIAVALRAYGAGATGAATSIYSKRIQELGAAVKRYQDALLEYHDIVKSNSAAASAAEQKAIDAFQKLQKNFGKEIKAITSGIRARRGLPLTNSSRALNIARSSRRIVKLQVFDQVQASRLVQFGKYGRFLGNGLAVIDFGSRVGNIHNSYKAGDNWYREMFIESTSFAASAGLGVAAANVGALLLALTPFGWIGLIVGGVIVAGAAATVSIKTDGYIKTNSGRWYDEIMKWLGSL